MDTSEQIKHYLQIKDKYLNLEKILFLSALQSVAEGIGA
jgi:hypothetical protein